MIKLVEWYGDGKNGLAADPALRFTWARRAADLDDPVGLHQLSTCYHFGCGTKANMELRMTKLAQAGMLGHVEAMHDLTVHHFWNDELAEALYWAKRGAKKEHFWNTESFIPILEKQIAEQRS